MKTDVVLLPGLHGSTALYDAFVALAPPWARCVPVPLPTLGSQSLDGLATTLEAELKRLEGFVLVAESYSGPIAVRLAARLGQKVSLLALCNPLVEMPVALPAGLAASAASWRGMPATAAAMVLADGDRALGQAALDGIRALPKEVLEARLRAAFAATAEEIAPLLAPPVLAILGSRDRLVSPERTKALLEGVPFASVAELDAPHLVVQTKPAEVWDAISDEFESAA
ncbi:MAG TPA: alpha/beta hydrolase [Thermoanaerobaculia bacterium]|nr:alpha/beta hydrolase [Thermoanaerobaculia bacterium]